MIFYDEVGGKGPESFKLSDGMTWSDQICQTKDAFFSISFTWKVPKMLQHFNKLIFYYFGYKTILITVQPLDR